MSRAAIAAAAPAPRPLRVLHVLAELKPSGAEVMLAVAAPLFAREGVACEIAATGPVPGPFADRLAAAGYPIHHLPFSKAPGHFLALHRLLRRGRYDAVHVHTERAAFWYFLTARLAGAGAVVKSIHNAFAFTGFNRAARALQRRLMAWAGVHQIAVGASVRATERERFGLDAPVINNWFDAARFAPPDEGARRAARAALGIDEGERVLVTVANCNAFKNHPALVEALALLPAARRPLWLHAGGEEPGQPERALAARLGVEGRIRFLGPRDDVVRLLHAADAFAMPSTQEGLPISALEAMACGLPGLLADAPGLRDLRATFPALLYAAPAAPALAGALAAWLDRPAEAWRREAAAHPALVRAAYGAEAGVAAYCRLYRGRP